jgi:nucleoside-diphosphate-sugar epimerase
LTVSNFLPMGSDLILVTGATGFVGSALVARLVREKIPTRACIRRGEVVLSAGVHAVKVDDLAKDNEWGHALTIVGTVIHTAARVHVMGDNSMNPLAEYRQVNVQGTLNLAEQAAAAGVRRFVFISSAKVNGEATKFGVPFAAEEAPIPLDPYGISKMEAELGLRDISAKTGMEVVIIRPPLVYGPGVKANFAALMKAVQRGWPLPLGAIHNQRSLVAIDNLVDLIATCITHPRAANETFLVSDGEDLSTAELVRRMALAAGVSATLLPVPVWALRAGAAIFGKSEMIQRLTGNLQVDISKTKNLLGWVPPITVDEGLRRAMVGIKLS